MYKGKQVLSVSFIDYYPLSFELGGGMRAFGWGSRYVGVFLLSTATLMFQVSYTRVLSVALWHHFVWMVVSIALLGYAASGTFLTSAAWLKGRDLDRVLTVTSALFSLSILSSYWFLNRVPFDPSRLSWDRFQLIYIAIYYLVLSLPFLLSGLAIGLSVERAGDRINRLYFSNLTGSALGAVLVLPLFGPLTGPGVIVFSALIAGASTIAFTKGHGGRFLHAATGWIIVLLILLPNAGMLLPIRMSPYKSLELALKYPDARLIETEWNAFSRVDVVESGFVRYAPGLSLRYDDPIPGQVGVIVDGDTLNAITGYGGDPASLSFTGALPSALPYRLRDSPRVLVLGAGGGLSVLTALHHDAREVTAVEANPIIVRLVRRDYGDFSGHIYEDERVRVFVAGGRSFIQGAAEEYDIIELPMAHGAPASSTGIYALSEDYIYTVESFQEFYEHLSDDGYLCVSTWLLPPPREDVRLVSLAVAALEEQGVREPSGHIAVIRSWGTITLLVGKNPLDAVEVAAVRGFCDELGFDIVYVPGVEASEVNLHNRFPEPIYYRLVYGMLHAEDREEFYESYLYDIRPITDERPFFFHFFRWDRIHETFESLERKWQPLIEGGFLVPLALLQALLLSVLLVLLPIRWRGSIGRGWSLLGYFFCLGLGYMFVEISAVQRFILLLDHPAYSISAVIFSLLLASGLGSYLSGRIETGGRGHKLVLIGLGLWLTLFGLASPVMNLVLGLPLALRLVAVFILVAPMGLLMGIPFPLGIELLSGLRDDLVPWAWAINGCASVLGSILPTILALSLGFSTVFLFAGLAYILSLVMITRTR
ncbi:MAG: hypothetical protein JSV18_00650 [Candidatus Bathyarchaeota archaeon]|nr:MAG: hypothetical protein JSV18_00650 [Candidatus Bathyarchaeota archaeon]